MLFLTKERSLENQSSIDQLDCTYVSFICSNTPIRRTMTHSVIQIWKKARFEEKPPHVICTSKGFAGIPQVIVYILVVCLLWMYLKRTSPKTSLSSRMCYEPGMTFCNSSRTNAHINAPHIASIRGYTRHDNFAYSLIVADWVNDYCIYIWSNNLR